MALTCNWRLMTYSGMYTKYYYTCISPTVSNNIKCKNEDKRPMATSLTWERVPFNKHICARQWSCHNSKKKKIIISFLRNEWLINYKNLSPFTKRYIAPSLTEISPVVPEKKILFSSMYFCKCIITISLLYPLGKWRGPFFEQTWIPFTQGCLVPMLVKTGQVI